VLLAVDNKGNHFKLLNVFCTINASTRV
jgi:hypothetical protein